jgi:hypothetical protein
MNQN